MSILGMGKSKANAEPVSYVTSANVNSLRHRITETRHAIETWKREYAGLEAASEKDWATDTLNRARRHELTEFMADGETRIRELSAQMVSADDSQAGERQRLEPEIEADMAELAALAGKQQEVLDRMRRRMDAHTAAGGHGLYNGQFQQMTDGVIITGAATGRFTATFTYETGKRLMPLPR